MMCGSISRTQFLLFHPTLFALFDAPKFSAVLESWSYPVLLRFRLLANFYNKLCYFSGRWQMVQQTEDAWERRSVRFFTTERNSRSSQLCLFLPLQKRRNYDHEYGKPWLKQPLRGIHNTLWWIGVWEGTNCRGCRSMPSQNIMLK